MVQRKRHGGAFKTRVAVEAIAGHKTINEIAGAFEVHPSQVAKWKAEALKRLPEGIPAFPGAWGGGMFTTGGRGGRIIEVINLNDSGAGSFRAAVEDDGPRIVIFRVARIIALESNIDIDNPDITIAGQSAPGDGICLANYSLNINT